MVTVSLLYSTILTLVPESIAGEKERGTLASLLLTPAKRTSIVSGKILALTVAAIASGCVSFIGLLSSLPKMVGGMQLNLHPLAVLTLFFVVATTLVLLVAFGLTISCFAKSTKEAASYLGPLTTVFIVLAIVPALTGVKGLAYGFIPIINLSMCMSEIVTLGTINISLLGLTILSNVVFTALLIFITTKLFKKEKIAVG
jgi:sodium transport system permease protein